MGFGKIIKISLQKDHNGLDTIGIHFKDSQQAENFLRYIDPRQEAIVWLQDDSYMVQIGPQRSEALFETDGKKNYLESIAALKEHKKALKEFQGEIASKIKERIVLANYTEYDGEFEFVYNLSYPDEIELYYDNKRLDLEGFFNKLLSRRNKPVEYNKTGALIRIGIEDLKAILNDPERAEMLFREITQPSIEINV